MTEAEQLINERLGCGDSLLQEGESREDLLTKMEKLFAAAERESKTGLAAVAKLKRDPSKFGPQLRHTDLAFVELRKLGRVGLATQKKLVDLK